MRRLPLVILIVVAVAALAACSSGSAPGWTYAPVPSASGGAAASGATASGATASSSPAAPGSAGPSTGPSAAPSAGGSTPVGSGDAGATTLTITAPVGAATSGWDPAKADAPANVDFQVAFDKQDNQAPHNLVFQNADGSAVPMTGDTAPFQGPAKKDYTVSKLAAGTYKYICQIHPSTMVGELTVK